MMAGRGAFRAPPSVCGAVGGREGEAWGGGRVRTPAQPPACPLRLHLQPAPRQRIAPKNPPPPHAATSGTLGHSAGRGQASVSASAGQAGGQGFRCARTTPRPMLPPPCVVSWGWWGCQGAPRPAPPSCIYKCCCV